MLLWTLLCMTLPIIAVCNDWKYGYTISNLFWIAPTIYFISNSFWRQGLRTLALLPMTGFVLDILFASRFFIFPNKDSVVGINIFGYNFATNRFDEPIPIEEFIFYIAGFAYTLFSYIYFSRLLYFDHMEIPKVLQFRSKWQKMGAFVLLISISYLEKWTLYTYHFEICLESYVPEYFWFLVLLGMMPVICTAHSVSRRIHLGAFLVTMFSVLFISITWEVTLAIPQGWWGYKRDPMIGFFIAPWSYLPLESVVVWICVSFTTIFMYEYLEGHE